jgi:hypothetical protein
MFESSFKDRRYRAVGHQGGSSRHRFGMFPWRLLDQDASRKQAVRHAPNFKSNVFHRARWGFFLIGRLMNMEPQPM